MAALTRPPANAFVRVTRQVYNPIGFSKGYNFILWLIFGGAMMGFALARFYYLDYSGVYCSSNPAATDGAAPGECYVYDSKDYLKIGIKLHLYTIIPAGFLAVFQFVPAIRYKVLLFHRLNGYLVILLSVAGLVGALMIARVAFGGGLEVQAFVGFLTIIFLGSLALAIYNIKRLQIEQHRAWMLRAWFYAGIVITSRFIMFIAAMVISSDTYYKAWPCDKIGSFYPDKKQFLDLYPACTSPDEWAAVKATMNGAGAENVGAVLNINFGMALWVALALHAIGVEVYLQLTPAEFERLRRISYQRQVEAGFKTPGRAGLTADRLGDSAKWTPALPECESDETLQGAVSAEAK